MRLSSSLYIEKNQCSLILFQQIWFNTIYCRELVQLSKLNSLWNRKSFEKLMILIHSSSFHRSLVMNWLHFDSMVGSHRLRHTLRNIQQTECVCDLSKSILSTLYTTSRRSLSTEHHNLTKQFILNNFHQHQTFFLKKSYYRFSEKRQLSNFRIFFLHKR